MKVRLAAMKLNNFKGVRDLTVEFDGQDTVIRGANETGKTTIVDAFHFLLFGYNSDWDHVSSKKFKIKTYDENGDVVHKLEHGVTADLVQIDGDDRATVTLRRVYRERWSEDRSTGEKRLKGHTQEFYVNGVEKSKGEYEDRVNRIIDEETFKLLTNPSYFANTLHWQDRRQVLLDMVEDPDHGDILAQNPKLEELDEALDEYRQESINDLEEYLSQQKTGLQDNMDELSGLLKEAKNRLVDIDEAPEDLEERLEELKASRNQVQEEITDLKAEGPEAELKARIKQAQERAETVKESRQDEVRGKIGDVKDTLKEARREKDDLESRLENAKRRRERKEGDLEEARNNVDRLRSQYEEMASDALEEYPDECPTCERQIGDEETAKLVYKKTNRGVSETLEEIVQKAGRNKDRVTDLERELAELDDKIGELRDKIAEAEQSIQEKEDRLEGLEADMAAYKDEGEYIEAVEEVEQLQEKLKGLEEPEELDRKREQLDHLNNQIDKTQANLKEIELSQDAQDRVDELRTEKKDLARYIEEYERLLYLVEQYRRVDIRLREDRINTQFGLVDWTLFESKVGGGWSEVCYPTVGGVPYPSLNAAAKVQAGMDIIRTLNERHSVWVPIFIDRRESVTTIPEMESQVISLYVDPSADVLTVEEDVEQQGWDVIRELQQEV